MNPVRMYKDSFLVPGFTRTAWVLVATMVAASVLDVLTWLQMQTCASCVEVNPLVYAATDARGPLLPILFRFLITLYVLFVARIIKRQWLRRAVLYMGIAIGVTGALSNLVAMGVL